jgi:hypothetical protein
MRRSDTDRAMELRVRLTEDPTNLKVIRDCEDFVLEMKRSVWDFEDIIDARVKDLEMAKLRCLEYCNLRDFFIDMSELRGKKK